MNVGCELEFELRVRGPLLIHSTETGPTGLDAVAMRDRNGHLVIPGDSIIGKLREAFDEAGSDPFSRLTRRNSIAFRRQTDSVSQFESYKAAELKADTSERYELFISDAISTLAFPRIGMQTHSLIQISNETNTAEHGMLRVYDCPLRPGEIASFRFVIRFLAKESEIQTKVDAIQTALNWIVSFGSEKSIGFGCQRGNFLNRRCMTRFDSQREESISASCELLIDWSFLDPLCVPNGVVNGNIFESNTWIHGEAFRGSIAQLLRSIYGKRNQLLSGLTQQENQPFHHLCQYFDHLHITDAWPVLKGINHDFALPSVVPNSLAWDGTEFLDMALHDCENPCFKPDWKSSQWRDIESRLGLEQPTSRLRVRTAIDSLSRRALDSNLFAYRMIDVEDHNWRNRVYVKPSVPGSPKTLSDRECRRIASDFCELVNSGWMHIGKTKSRCRGVSMVPSQKSMRRPIPSDGKQLVSITLRASALLLAPWDCVDATGTRVSDLEFDERFQKLWSNLSNGSLREVSNRRFARETLVGGYLAHRYRYVSPDAHLQVERPYNPTLLWERGSVFVFDVVEKNFAMNLLAEWERFGLPVPKWAVDAYGKTYETNNFIPQNGYGEIDVNWELPAHSNGVPL